MSSITFSNLSCGICFETIIADIGSVETCGHIFHLSCGNKWITENNSCPMCRASCNGMKKLMSCPRISKKLEIDPTNPSFEALWTRVEEFHEKINKIEMENDSLKSRNQMLNSNYRRLNANIKKSTRDYKIFQLKTAFMASALNNLRKENAELKKAAMVSPEYVRDRKEFYETMRNLEMSYINRPDEIMTCSTCKSRHGCIHSTNILYQQMELELVKVLRSLKDERDKNIKLRVQIEEVVREASFYQSIKDNPELIDRCRFDSTVETPFPLCTDSSGRSFMYGPIPNHVSALDFLRNISLDSNLNPFEQFVFPELFDN